jgi:hypothetical protein
MSEINEERVYQMVRLTGIEPVCPLFRKAADFKSAVSTYFTTVACMLFTGKRGLYIFSQNGFVQRSSRVACLAYLLSLL